MTTNVNSVKSLAARFENIKAENKEQPVSKKALNGKYEVSVNDGSILSIIEKGKFGGATESAFRRNIASSSGYYERNELDLMGAIKKVDDVVPVMIEDTELMFDEESFEDINYELSEPTPITIPAIAIEDAYADLPKKPESSLYQLTFGIELEEDACDVNEDLYSDVHADLDWDMADNGWDAELKTIQTVDGAFDVDGKEFENFEKAATSIDSAKAALDSFSEALSADGEDMDVILSIDEENETEAASVVEKHDTATMEKHEAKTVSVLKKYEVSLVPVSTTLSELLTPPKRKVGNNVSRLIAFFDAPAAA